MNYRGEQSGRTTTYKANFIEVPRVGNWLIVVYTADGHIKDKRTLTNMGYVEASAEAKRWAEFNYGEDADYALRTITG